MKMRYIYILLLLALSLVTGVNAQNIVIKGTVDVQSSGNDLELFAFNKYIVVYTFMKDSEAKKALEDLEKNPNIKIEHYFNRTKPEINGDFTVEIGREGSMLVWCSDRRYESAVYERNRITSGMKVNLSLRRSKDGEKHKELDNIDVVESIINRKQAVIETVEDEGYLESSVTIPIPYRAKSNMRVVAQPLWYDRIDYVDEESDTVFSYGNVVYRDLREYGITQTRLVDYDNMRDTLQNINARIKNNRYSRIINHNVKTKKGVERVSDTICSRITLSKNSDTIFVHILDTLSGHDPNGAHPYPFCVMVALGDYNTILYKDSTKDNGERRSPLKFLDFSFKEFLPNSADFEEKLEDERIDVPGELHLNFLVGRAEVAPNDSFSIAQLETLRKTFSDIINDPTGTLALVGVTVFGQASPEGNLQHNKDLARRRAQYAIGEIRKFTERAVQMKEPEVAGWDKVADLLIADGYHDEAEAVNEIINKYPGRIEVQNQYIYKLPYYNSLIKETYLPKLRTVRYEYKINKFGTPDPEVVLARYKANKKAVFSRGEYWTLFNYITDWAELEEVSKYALEVTRTTSGADAEYCKGYWPYPACLLACCYIARDTSDLNLLMPFLHLKTVVNDSTGEREVEHLRHRRFSQEVSKRLVEYVNFPEFAANHLIMILSGDGHTTYRKQVPLLEAIMKGQGAKYDTIMAVSKCYRGGYRVGKVSTSEEEAEWVRNVVSSTSVTNSVVINLAADNPSDPSDDSRYLVNAKNEMNMLPDNAVSDYLKSIIALRLGDREKSELHLANSFNRDFDMMAVATNDKDLITADGSEYRVVPGALAVWKDSINVIAANNDSHPYTWYKRSLDELLKNGDKANLEMAEKAMHRCFDIDKRYITVLNVSLKNDNAINKKEKLVKILKKFRNNYKLAE